MAKVSGSIGLVDRVGQDAGDCSHRDIWWAKVKVSGKRRDLNVMTRFLITDHRAKNSHHKLTKI